MRASYANRGKAFEKLIERANSQYASKGMAIVQKVPTPWIVIRKGSKIISAYPEEKSTVDFMGVANGKAIAFDAKSTREVTRFPLSNIEQHQMDFLKAIDQQGGRAFFLIEYATKRETYVISYTSMSEYWENAKRDGRKSIPYSDMSRFHRVTSERGISLDYLKVVI